MTRRRRIGILGGTFDPVHIGHLHIAQCARQDLDLDVVVLMPAGSPPHKPEQPVASPSMRLDMINIAIRDAEGLVSSDLDLQLVAPSYTSELLATFSRENPGSDVWFIIGSDSLNDFPGWHDPGSILRFSRLAVVERPGWPTGEVLDRLHLPDLRESVDQFSSVPVDISASAIRSRLKDGLSVDWLVPAEVLAFISEAGLYRVKRHE